MIIGIDIGGTNTVLGLVDPFGVVLAQDSLKTTNYSDAAIFIADLSQIIKKFCDQYKVTIKGIGIGCPNGNYYTGSMVGNAPNMPFKEEIPFVQYFREHFKVHTVLTNDANAAALGEMIYGKAKGLKNFALITIGTGLGSGFIADGRLILGVDSLAGELGHSIIEQGGRVCGCGRNGCLEKYVSASGIYQTYAEICEQYQQETKTDNFKGICRLAYDYQDNCALLCFEKTGRILGLALSNMATVTAPEKIFLFGGIVSAGELLLKPTIQSFEENLLFVYQNKIHIEISGLIDKNAAILGAAALAADPSKF